MGALFAFSNAYFCFMSLRPLILVSNDDGITAPGIRALVEVALEFGDVLVVAPDKPQSAMGHAITINQPIRLVETHNFDCSVLHQQHSLRTYQCSGTPVDCVKIAIDKLLDRRPDIMLSGINHGSNASINVIYSGTMSAAVEASIDGMKAIGFSLCDYAWDADFEPAKSVIRKLVTEYLNRELPYGTLLNVNMPKGEIKGIKACRQASAKWKEDFDKRVDPFGRDYYWMTGQFINEDHGQDTDEYALSQGFASVVPTQFDLTDHNRIGTLNQWGLDRI